METVALLGSWERTYRLAAGAAVEVNVRLERPSSLPDNGRVAAEWTLVRPDRAAEVQAAPEAALKERRALELDTAPTADWRKVLHALDPDVYTVYRAPIAGTYRLKLAPVTDEPPVGAGPRWREKGTAPDLFPVPGKTPWPAGTKAAVGVSVMPIDLGTPELVQKTGAMIEAEPNDSPELAQSLALVPNNDIRTYEITGTADDIEYFDNGKVGRSGDDWFRLTLQGTEKRLLTAQLGIPGQQVAARIRVYQLKDGVDTALPLGGVLPVSEYLGKVNPKVQYYNEDKLVDIEEGRDPNERVHQQDESHRSNITRLLEPGKTYYLRVEANAPGYQLQLRVLRPAPYTDPVMAVRQAMYTQIGQVDAWLTNRPRGASVDRRIRDSGNLLGTQCMSCHTQSGVWGPAVPLAAGYRLENVQPYRHLLSVMYECLRPTNELKDAANNTSLAPLDIGDGPAGTRAAGFNIINAEGVFTPAKLHSKQQIRTANFVLQTKDPGGINAAGPGSNYGQNIVWLFAGEILKTAWQKSGDPKYFRALEEKARKVLAYDPKFTDDVAVRMDFFGRVFPVAEYPAEAAKAAEAERAAAKTADEKPEDLAAFCEKVKAQLAIDEARVRAIQQEDGTWGFTPGTSPEGGKGWKRPEDKWDPAPTALCITGLASLGYGKDDPTIAKGVAALLRLQEPSGRWNRAAITGFVTAAYAMRALGHLYPVKSILPARSHYQPRAGESLLESVQRVQAIALRGDPALVDLARAAAKHPSPLVRYWALIGIGATPGETDVPVLLAALKDRTKPVREAATWALRQALLHDHGWAAVLSAAAKGDDFTRAQVYQALGIRADAVMPRASLDWTKLTAALDRGMNDDPHPAVRAWAAKAAWQWWVWNPPVRSAVNQAWVRLLERPEANPLVENSQRYSSQALFIANGHISNGSKEHQYKELAALFEALRKRLEQADADTKSLLARRLVSIAGTFYKTRGSDGGPGQLGYVTTGSGELIGQAVTVYLRETLPGDDRKLIAAGLEAAANVPHGPLQEFLVNYALKAPDELRKLAADAVSDPRSASLAASIELVEPLVAQVMKGAADPGRRDTLSEPVLQLFAKVMWKVPENEEQQRLFFDLMLPKLDTYYSSQQLKAETDGAKRALMEREMESARYLADRFGQVLAENPDLNLPIVLRRYFPTGAVNPLQRHFWVRSVPWILEKTPAMAAPAPAAGAPAQVDPLVVARDRALQLYLDALSPSALPETRAAAIRISNQTSVRRNPEVLLALRRAGETEPDDRLKRIARNVVRQGSEEFVPDLVAALRSEGKPSGALRADGTPEPALLEDITYFRDYVMPELSRVKRNDQFACLGCHGVPGRVPSLTLKPVDDSGYLPVSDLLTNYRELQARVNLKDVPKSKLLRKPLNVQDGTEDGHQGGRRYAPDDEGYLILKKWAENQVKVQGLGQMSAQGGAESVTYPPTPFLKEGGVIASRKLCSRFDREGGSRPGGTRPRPPRRLTAGRVDDDPEASRPRTTARPRTILVAAG